jgi:hypothetical protein
VSRPRSGGERYRLAPIRYEPAAMSRNALLHHVRLALAIVLAWLACATVVVAQSTPTQCTACAGRAEIACKKHGKDGEIEVGVVHCSVAADCKACGGTLRTDCRACVDAAVDASALARRALVQDWLRARRTSVDALSDGKTPLLHAKTAHVDMTFSIRPLTVGRTRLDTHEAMHLYLRRVDELRTLFMKTFELTDEDFTARLQLFLFADAVDHQRISPHVANGGGTGISRKWMGVQAVLSLYHDQRTMPGDEGLHRSIVHNVTHLLLSNVTPEYWLGNRKSGWVDEGVAHWFEELVTGKCTNYCYEEVALTPGAGFKGGRWRVPIRRLVDGVGGKLRPFAELATKNTDQLDWQDHAHAFACVDFLIRTYGGKAFAGMVRDLKRDLATRDAIEKAFGLTMLTFDEAFAKYVKANYPLQETVR